MSKPGEKVEELELAHHLSSIDIDAKYASKQATHRDWERLKHGLDRIAEHVHDAMKKCDRLINEGKAPKPVEKTKAGPV